MAERIIDLPAAEWLPDLPAEGSPGATEALNVVPRTNKSYGPLADVSAYSTTPLNARCQGAFSGRAASGTVSSFAGDASKLYKLSNAAYANVSRSSGYVTAADEHWRFAQMGERVIATNFHDTPQVWTLDSSTTFSNLTGAPSARHVALIDPGFLMFGNLSSAPNGVQWSGINDPTSYPTPGSSSASLIQSGANFNLDGGWVQAIVGAVGGAQGAVFMEKAIYGLEYVGPPDVFAFRQREKLRGTPAPNSVVNVGPMAFYLGEDDFYAFDGTQSVPLGANKVAKSFFAGADALDPVSYHRVYGAADPINKLVVWAYPTNAQQNPNRLIIHNWQTGWWSHAQITCEILFRALSVGYTLDQLDSLGYNIDTLPFSLDSRVLTGGRLILSAFNTSHNIGFFTGSNLAATVETAESDGGAGRRMTVSGIRPRVDGGTITCAVGYRDNFSSGISYTTPTSVGADGFAPQRISARLGRAQINIAAGGSWTHLWGAQARASQEGRR